MNLKLPEAGYCVSFLLLKSFQKKDWLMCPACEKPQYLFEGCCFDPECDPHVFRMDWGCIHCSHPLNIAPLQGFDVEQGQQTRLDPDWRELQEEARRQYENCTI